MTSRPPRTVAPSPPAAPRRRVSRLVIAGLALSCLLAAVAVWQLRSAADLFLASRLRTELAAQPPERAPELLRAALDLGAPGQALAVECLGSPQGALAQSALLVLQDRIEVWQSGDVPDGQQHLESLARELARATPWLDTGGRQRAGRLAQQLLQAPSRAAGSELVAHCEQVLRASMFASAASAAPAARSWTLQSPPSEGPVRETGEPGPRLPDSPKAAAGSGLEYQPYRPALPKYGPARAEGAAVRTPRENSTPARTLAWKGGQPAPAPGDAPLPERTAPAADTPTTPATKSASTSDSSNTIDLMRRLHGDAAAERAARSELTARGFGQLEIELARRLTDDDPEVRRQLAEWLPRLPGVDARPWLMWLSEDTSPRVRMLAATLMSTSSDPALLERVTEMYRGDPDADVRKQAGQRQPAQGRGAHR